MITPSEFLKYLMIFGVPFGGGGGAGVSAEQVQQSAFNTSAATGVDDAFIVTLDPAVTALTDGLIVSMSSGALQNLTESPTLQVNALAAKDIVLWSGAVSPGDIQTSSSYIFIYRSDSDDFELINPSVSTANAFFVQANEYNTGIDTGAANAYAVTLLINPPGSFSPGFSIYLQVGAGNDNTGASTITVNGETDAIVNPDGSALEAGAILGSRIYLLLYNATYGAWVLTNSSFNEPSSGTWTPTIIASTPGSPTYDDQTGYWSKVGDMVTVWFRVQLSGLGGLSGVVGVSGLPFNQTALFGTVRGQGVITSAENMANFFPMTLTGSSGTLFNILNSEAYSSIPVQDSDLTNTTALMGTFTYQTE